MVIWVILLLTDNSPVSFGEPSYCQGLQFDTIFSQLA
uniref:Uncharacterized protein n=1 Tax=Arundo donax TaxID=35708 RepID=A0A0A9BQP6_ARUDO